MTNGNRNGKKIDLPFNHHLLNHGADAVHLQIQNLWKMEEDMDRQRREHRIDSGSERQKHQRYHLQDVEGQHHEIDKTSVD